MSLENQRPTEVAREEIEKRVKERVAKGLEESSPDEVVAMAVAIAVANFERRTRELLDMVVSDHQMRSRSSYRPPHVVDAAEGIPSKTRKRIEGFVDRALQDLEGTRDLLAVELGTDSADDFEGRRSTVVNDWMGALAVLLVGPQSVKETFSGLVTGLASLGDGAVTYGVSYLSWRATETSPSSLHAAAIQAATAEFEGLLASLLRIGGTLHPDSLGVHKRSFTLAQIQDAGGTADDVRMVGIAASVDDILSEGIGKWSARFQRWPGINLEELAPEWWKFVEIFLRRNVLVHNSGFVDDDYLRNLPAECEHPPVGSQIALDFDYTVGAIDQVAELGATLGIMWANKIRPSIPVDSAGAVRIVYRALETKRWSDAHFLGELLGSFVDPVTEDYQMLLVNTWLGARESADSVEAIRDDVNSWTPPEEGYRWRLARPALLLDETAAEQILKVGRAEGIDLRPLFHQQFVILLAKRYPRLQRFDRPPQQVMARQRRRH